VFIQLYRPPTVLVQLSQAESAESKEAKIPKIDFLRRIIMWSQ
jgi:hypothetical protein